MPTCQELEIISPKCRILKSQIGNPDGKDFPNKKYYDPRKWVREGEKTFIDRLKQALKILIISILYKYL